MKASSAVQVNNLSKSIGDAVILEDISLCVPEGAIAGVIGRSGAGKTTLLRCLNGLEQPSHGEITLFGKDILSLDNENRRFFQRKIGTVFQNFHLLSRRTVAENIAFPLEIRGTHKTVIQERVRDILELVGLGHKAKAYPKELSGGQCQRVAIARAIVADVRLLLCDEFTSALDPETTLEILELLSELNRKLGLTIILITHDMNVVREICHTVFVLEAGRCVEEGVIARILLNPIHDATKSLIGSLFRHELPHMYKDRLNHDPFDGAHVVLRMLFADQSAKEPIIASLVEQFHLPINIIAGHLDHIRETAFGQLMISFPYVPTVFTGVKDYLRMHDVSSELVGYLHA